MGGLEKRSFYLPLNLSPHFSSPFSLPPLSPQLDPKCALYWSNRCQASLGCYNYAQAKEDAQKGIVVVVVACG